MSAANEVEGTAAIWNEECTIYIIGRILSCFPKLSSGVKFDQLFQTEGNLSVLTAFYSEKHVKCLIVPESLKIFTVESMPSKLPRAKLLALMKLADGVNKENFSSSIVTMELGGLSSFLQLEILLNRILLPVISNMKNQRKWGEVATQEITQKFLSFLASSVILCGHVKGETLLPVPPFQDESAKASSTDLSKISFLEGAIVTWTKQIKNILKLDSDYHFRKSHYPVPNVEIQFWKNKASSLNSIFEQLKSERIRRVLNALDQAKSTYCTTFARLCKEVFDARREANDNVEYLRTLEPILEKLAHENDFASLAPLFKPLFHVVLLIWKYSRFYNTPARFAVLVREICNLLISQAYRELPASQIFTLMENDDASTVIAILQKILMVSGLFKTTFSDYKTKAAAECTDNPWRIQSNSLFARLDSFLERCHNILDLVETSVQFSKISKIEIGGTKGKELTASLRRIQLDFQRSTNNFKELSYDIMDVESGPFDSVYSNFRKSVKELDLRLAAVMSIALGDCPTVYGKFQLLDSFDGGLLERSIIQDELESRKIDLVHVFGRDLRVVQETFISHRDDPPKQTTRNLPPVAGSLVWCRGLLARIEIPMTKLQKLDRAILDREEAKEVAKIQSDIVSSLIEFETSKIEDWASEVSLSSDAKLHLPLLVRSQEHRTLKNNFDSTLVKLLREVKYFLMLDLKVPQSALDIFESAETFRSWIGNIDLIVNMNNEMLGLLLPVERPLIAPYLTKFDHVAERGLAVLHWRSHGVDEFISDAMKEVTVVHSMLHTMKQNFVSIEEIVSKWVIPFMQRKNKPVDKEDFEHDFTSSKSIRFAEMRDSDRKIHELINETSAALRVSNSSLEWRGYVDFVDNIIVDGLAASISASLEYLIGQIEPSIIKNQGKLPLLEIKLQLDDSTGVLFDPSMTNSPDHTGVMDLIDGVVGSIFHVASLVRRLNADNSYIELMRVNEGVVKLVSQVTGIVSSTQKECEDLKGKFEAYSFLWKTNPQTYFSEFCKNAKIISAHGTVNLDLKKFDEAIQHYAQIQKDISKFKSSVDVGWLRVNKTQVKQQISMYATKWMRMFTSHMLEFTVRKLTDHHAFVNSSAKSLERIVEDGPGQKESLMAVMSVIRDVKKKADSIAEIFEPQNECIQILRRHGVDTIGPTINGRNIQDFLEEAPLAWEAVVKKAFKKKEEILSLQNASVDELKFDLDRFYTSIREFRGEFRANAPFKFSGSAADAHKKLDTYELSLQEIEEKVSHLHELEDLFELQQTRYLEIGETRVEIKHLRSLWAFKATVDQEFDGWQKTLWHDVDTVILEEKNKKLRKQLKDKGNLFTTMKGWQVYKDIEEAMDVMAIVLPLINDLHSDAMRERHWSALARICSVKSVDPSNPCFALKDMLDLRLHKHKVNIEEVVETSMKELKIEKKLKEIEKIWGEMTLDYIPHKDTATCIPKLSEILVEEIESHQMELQGIFGMGKFMEYFRDRVIHWQLLLRVVDDTLRLWLTVSRSWASLETIFLSSEDIKSQLPEDAARFEGIDADFKDLMMKALSQTNCIKVCSVEGRFDALKGMLHRLELCQKSLNEYLDIKKKIFPRFYFVSSVALLDMLANGTNPPKIMCYLGDCYDALANLRFVRTESGEQSTKMADSMIAKDGEEVALSSVFVMEGEVEAYLNRLTVAMQLSLKIILSDAIEKAVNWEVETPRHEWLFSYPAQLCITGTQIYWTDETQLALEEYEAGQEDVVKRYLQVCNTRLSSLIDLVLGELVDADRTKIISLITMDVHSRDVVDRMVSQKVEGPSAFAWQQQLRFEWDQASMDVDVKICDFACKYFYEWVGNTGRLVITPLTDRCYITLTMGLKLFLGGAPAGPAGTGKTETTKDLARALAIPCYVFNCSSQMNFQSMADIFRGLAQTGAWGCFDEFNRISVEVLSVIATQVKTIQDAIRKFSRPENRQPEFQHYPAGTPPVKVGFFDFMGDTISLIPSCGFWITMNPGYAGRTELPENLKALFRSCAMIRPDMKLIQENMLMAEGFQMARPLSVKFFTLYELSSSLLSKQPHYDWGLRAVKSVLRVAGSMKRANPNLDESQVLMRALRDFNTPKLPIHDIPIFLRLINDLFMGLTVDSRIDDTLKGKIIRVAKEQGLQYDDMFVNKTCNFQVLLDVRHSVMLLGPSGCGKTTIWKTLQAAYNLDKPKKVCIAETVNPKALTGDELYGYMTLAKDWKDGTLSIIMRGMSKNFADQGFHDYQVAKWVVLDGDIDAEWIESMNTVMDDNKVLTLVSNERVPLSPSMRMVFEINSLKNATPATVSRAGILYINEVDIGWRPLMETWVHNRKNAAERNHLPSLFERYVETLQEITRRGYKEVTNIRLINKVSTIIYLLEGLLSAVPDEKLTAESIEMVFAFSAMWAFGGPMVVEKALDYRKKFSAEFCSAFGGKIPKEGMCFDYFYNIHSGEYVHWQTEVPKHSPVKIGNKPGESPFNTVFVETVETTRMMYMLNKLARNGRHVMFAGNAGTGKTEIIKKYLGGLNKETDGIITKSIVMSFYTSSQTLQQEIEMHIDKRSGTSFGPPMGKKLIFFVDDMNLPYVETYGTQNSIALLTQHMQHGSIFDRTDLGMRKHLSDIQYVAAMNPTAGSFEICERCQRHFATFAVTMPSQTDLSCIFGTVFGGHLEAFQPVIQELSGKIVNAAIQIHDTITLKFLPSAVKFMYNWNMRELANVFQGCCNATNQYYIKPEMLIRLFIHETRRVYCDRLVSESEGEVFDSLFKDVVKKNFSLQPIDDLFSSPLVYTNFATTSDGSYLPVPSMEKLKSVLDAKLIEYNESNAMMDLVLFEQAMLHITRISRIIQNPGGNAMLIGVGGSGKQSLTRLAAFINNFEVKQLVMSSNFTVEDLKENLRNMYLSAGVKGSQVVFLLTDSQISDERFLVYINSILTSGWIADLFPKEDIDNILGSIASDAKAAGIADTNEARIAYFIARIRMNLHLVLAFSPVGEVFRVRARRFPGLVNCTGIDQFHPWPRDALISVAERFLRDIEISGPDDTKSKLSIHMAEEHTSVTKISQYYLETQRRYNYVTPKSFLELISFFKYLLGTKRSDLQRLIDRLDVGLATLRRTSDDVAELQKNLKMTMEKVEEKKRDTDILIKEMEIQKSDAKTQQDAAEIEAQKANEESDKAQKIEAEAEEELGRAKPAMEAAAAAVDCLSKPMLTELKNLSKPPSGVDRVTNACLILIEKEYNPKKQTWERAKKMMQNVDAFKNKLAEFRGESITDQEISLLQEYINDEVFTPEKMQTKSAAAANCCNWVVNIYAYNRIYVKVKPLMDLLEEARAKKALALTSLESAQKNVAEVQEKLKILTEKYEAAVRDKQEVEDQAQALSTRADLAQRLVGGLASENIRWSLEIENLKKGSLTLTGDCMLAAGFVSYVGAFDQELRQELWKKQWTADLVGRNIPMTVNSDPLTVLTNKKDTAKMISEGLPSDRVSIENGSIVTNCKRWPLIIDPQNQGIKWLKKREDGNTSVIQLTQKNWTKVMQNAITNGHCVIIENLGSEIDAVLDPVLSRAIYKKGRSLYLRFGGEEVEYHMAFQLYLQTKLSNPRYRPETLAQCTLVNFIATEKGLEDQLLARVVEMERKDLEEKSRELSRAEIAYQMQLVALEDELLERLANAPDDILGDVALIEGLEATKKTVKEINQAVETGRTTLVEVENAREAYRPQASEGAMLYFLLTKLYFIEHMYQYSLDSFISFFEKSVQRAEHRDNLTDRVNSLTDSLRMTIFAWVARGLFERHKLIFLSQLTFNLLKRGVIGDVEWNEAHFQFLLRDQSKTSEPNPLSWLPNRAWSCVLALDEIEGFSKFKSDLVEASPRFREWYNSLTAENEKLPLDWAGLDKTPFQKMLVVRCLRPDRLSSALMSFIRSVLPNGSKYVDCDSNLNTLEILDLCFQDSTPTNPLYFILSPGANVVGDLDKLATKYGFQKGISYHNVSMGQGQDVIAMSTLKAAHQHGHWVILNNIHLMPKWCIELEKCLDQFASEGSHEKFRVFLTSDPADSIPIGILNRCIKITNEPPTGLKANLKRAWCFFPKEYIEENDSKTKSILFGLCFFHSLMMERKTFGAMGFNMKYPFSIGDLRDSAACLQNYMDNSSGGKIPWQDLKYIFGEIMYGGHIVNDFDRLVANEYLNFIMKDELLDETEMYPFVQDEKSGSFMSPTPTTFEKYIDHIQQNMGADTPIAFGLHSNAEIDMRTQQSTSLFKTLLELQPQEAANGDNAVTPQQIAEAMAIDILDKYSEKIFDVEDIARNLEEIGPFQNVFLQEMDVMNVLLVEIKRSLKELQMGFAGELTMSDSMESLLMSLYLNKVPESWTKRAWPSTRSLASWLSNLMDRLAQLEEWMNNPSEIPKVTWISGLVNPTSFLTAICQVAAQKNRWELDKLVTLTEVTKRMSVEEVDAPSRDGAYITGLSLQGARWDVNGCQLEKSQPKEMFCKMPVINVRAVTKEKASVGGIYHCPVYLTETRGPTWYFNAQLKTKSPPARWVLAGVALIADTS